MTDTNSPDSQQRRHRNRSIRSAIGTSLVSKLSSSILQFLSLPLAARVLGREEFGVYATISLAVFAVAILQLGVGPALARGISEAAAKGDRLREGRLYVSGAILVTLLAGLGVLFAAVALVAIPIPTLFGAEYAPFIEKMQPALWVGIFLMAAQIVVFMTDRVREGYMESSVVNTWAAVGNFAGAVIVFGGVGLFPSVTFLLLAVFGPNIVARLISTVLLLKKRPWLVARQARPRRDEMGELLRDGLSFSATSVVVYFVEFVACALIVGRVSGPQDVAIFHVLMSITTAFTGMLVMVGRPFWAAIIDAKSSGDREWMVTSTRRYYLYLVALTLGAGVALIGFGPWLVPMLYGADFTVDRLLFVGHALFLFAVGWRLVNRYLAIGLGLLPMTVFPILAGLAAGLSAGVIGLKLYGLWAMFVGLGAGTLFLTGLLLFRIVNRDLHGARGSDSEPSQTCESSPGS